MSSIQGAPSEAGRMAGVLSALPTHLVTLQARGSLPGRPRRPALPSHSAVQRSLGCRLEARRSPSRGTWGWRREPTPRREGRREQSLALDLGPALHTEPVPARAAMLGRSSSAAAREAC